MLCWLVATTTLAAQDQSSVTFDDVRLVFSGASYGFPAPDDEQRFVFVVLDGVEVYQADRRMRANNLVVVLARTESNPADDDEPTPFLGNRRVVELFMDGNVSLEEADEQVANAEAAYLDNVTGELTLLEGHLRGDNETTPLILRFHRMKALSDGRREIAGLTFTTCDYDHAHWGIETDWALLEQTPDGRVLSTGPSIAQAGDVPLLWWPGTRINIDSARLPIEGFEFGSSSRFGTELRSLWSADMSHTAQSVTGLFGHTPERMKAELEFEVSYLSDRGLFLQPTIDYETEDSFGKFFVSYINDSASTDDSTPPGALPGTMPSRVPVDSRYRIDLEHRTRLDETKTIDIEVSKISDRNYLNEYYESEFREGKEQETYINYRDVEDNEAFQVLARIRANDFQEQVEYLPSIDRRVLAESTGETLFGEGFISTRDNLSYIRYRPDDDALVLSDDNADGVFDLADDSFFYPDSFEQLRIGRGAQIDFPIDLDNGDRVLLNGNADVTYFSKSNGHGATVRTSVGGALQWARTYSGVDDSAQDDFWNIEGLRHIVEPYLRYENRFHLSRSPDELAPPYRRTMGSFDVDGNSGLPGQSVLYNPNGLSGPIPIDEINELSRQNVLTAGLRDRIQTHQNGEVVTILDTEIMVPFYFNPGRDNDGTKYDVNIQDDDDDNFFNPSNGADGRPTSEVEGNIYIDSIWTPGANTPWLRNASANWQASIDPNNGTYRESYLNFRTDIDEEHSFFIANNKGRNVFNFLTVGTQWELNNKWSAAVFVQRDLRLNEEASMGFILRQRAHRWLIDIEFSRERNDTVNNNNRDEDRITVSFRPAALEEGDLLENISSRVR